MKKCGAAYEPATLDDVDRRAVFRTRIAEAEPPAAELSPPAPAAADLTPRQAAIAKRPSKKICEASDSSGRHVWADITDILLYQIIVLFCSFHDFLAVTGTCSHWRTAVSFFPSEYTFTFPPLHLKPGLRYAHRHVGWYNPLSNYKWQLRDPAKTNLSFCRSAPRNTPSYMCYLGCSYGYLIFSCREHFVLVDVYTCTKVKLPKLRANRDCLIYIYYGILMAPLNSPNSRLLLLSRASMFQWNVRTKSWTEHPFVSKRILQIVFFKGQMFAMDYRRGLYTISMAPEVSMREVAVVWGEKMVDVVRYNPWLVVCGDMLLMVDLSISIEKTHGSYQDFLFMIYHNLSTNGLSGFEGTFQVFRLDFSAEPAKWVKIEKLENWALFVSLDRRNPTFSCRCPERWGGKSNCIYVPSASRDSEEPWIAVELGQSVSSATHPISYALAGESYEFESLWVLPSLVYGDGQ